MSMGSGDYESVLAAALLQQPERWAEVARMEPGDYANQWMADFATAGRRFLQLARDRGTVQWPVREAIERVSARLLRPSGGTPEVEASRKTRAAAVRNQLDVLGGWGPITEHEFRDALELVRQGCADRRLKRGLLDVARSLTTGGTAASVYQQLVEITQSISPVSTDSPEGTLQEDVPGVLARYRQAALQGGVVRIPTQFPHLNMLTGGMRYGRLWLVAGYTGHGKTQLAKELVYTAATVHGRSGLIFTSEQTKGDVEAMLAVRHSHHFTPGGLPMRAVMDNTLTPQQLLVLEATVQDMALPGKYGQVSYVQVPTGTSMADVRMLVERYSRKHPIDYVMLDHTMLFSPTHRTGSRNDDTAGVIMEAKALSLEYNRGRGLQMIACHQINRAGYEAAQTRGFYVNADLAATSEAERSADLVLWILRTEALCDTREALIGISKNRWGASEPKGWVVHERFDSAAMFALDQP